MIRVAFILPNLGNDWLGGVNYYRNLLTALPLLQPKSIQPVLFVGSDAPADGFLQTVGTTVEIVRTSLFDRKSLSGVVWRLSLRIPRFNALLLTSLLARHGVDVLSHHAPLAGGHVKTASWIPDFQHIHLPRFFSGTENRRRTAEFLRYCHDSDRVILSSGAALDDLVRLAPEAAGKARVLQFTPDISLTPPKTSVSDLEKKYNFQGSFFHLPNQFWAHKNHDLIIDALHRLKQKGLEVVVIATGRQNDYRNPTHFSELMEKVRHFGLEQNFLSVGVVPYAEMLAFMWHSKAVINPSLFEGWSSTVEEAKYLGKTVLLSDLKVHREQNPDDAWYFSPTDADAAAAVMSEVWTRTAAPAAAPLEELQRQYQIARCRFAEAYQSIIEELAGASRLARRA